MFTTSAGLWTAAAVAAVAAQEHERPYEAYEAKAHTHTHTHTHTLCNRHRKPRPQRSIPEIIGAQRRHVDAIVCARVCAQGLCTPSRDWLRMEKAMGHIVADTILHEWWCDVAC
jgi:hypothetical protein